MCSLNLLLFLSTGFVLFKVDKKFLDRIGCRYNGGVEKWRGHAWWRREQRQEEMRLPKYVRCFAETPISHTLQDRFQCRTDGKSSFKGHCHGVVPGMSPHRKKFTRCCPSSLSCISAIPGHPTLKPNENILFLHEKSNSGQMPRSNMLWNHGKVRARTCGTDLPSRSEALRYLAESIDKVQCFRSAWRIGAAGSSPGLSRVFFFHNIWLLGICQEILFSCTTMSYPGQPFCLHSFLPGHHEDIFYFWKKKMSWNLVVPTSCACSQFSVFAEPVDCGSSLSTSWGWNRKGRMN